MIIGEFKFALYSLLGGFVGTILSLLITKKITWLLSFLSIVDYSLFIIVLSLLLERYKN